MKNTLTFQQILDYCKFDYVPESLAAKYEAYTAEETNQLINRQFLTEICSQYNAPPELFHRLEEAITAIEKDDILFPFTLFLVDVLGEVRNQCDTDFYTNMTPEILTIHKELYSFIVLLACIEPSIARLKQRGVPSTYYEAIPHQPLKTQLEKLIKHNDAFVHDFQWFLNFYSCSIFLLDRFLFIPHKFDDSFKVFRNKQNNDIMAFYEPDHKFRRDGQPEGVNGIFDNEQSFTTVWIETNKSITANRINPLGFVSKETYSILKEEWDLVLDQGDRLLALHVPAGPGYEVERLKNSMTLALDFYKTYFPELNIKGFWSSSWLYDSKLSLVLKENAKIVQMQRQMFTYPTGEDDSMLRYELFGSRQADPLTDELVLKTSLQRDAVAYMKRGGRFNTLSMFVLKEEVQSIGMMPYIKAFDKIEFSETVATHL